MTVGSARRRLAGVVDALTVAVLLLAVFTWLRPRGENPVGVPELAASAELDAQLWSEAWRAAHHRGDSTARVKVLQFSDFECPACRVFAEETSGLVDSLRGVVAMGYLHFPLGQHRFAKQAALVAECTAAKGEFWRAHDSLFVHQNDFGLISWEEILGKEADELQSLRSCIGSSQHLPVLARHRALAERVDASGTPTVIVNGHVLNRRPTRAELDSLINLFATSGGGG